MSTDKAKRAQEARFRVLMSQAQALGLLMPDQAEQMTRTVDAQIIGVKQPDTDDSPLAELERNVRDFDVGRGLMGGQL